MTLRQGFLRRALALALILLAVVWLVPRLNVPPEFWFARVETVTLEDRPLRLVLAPSYSQGLRGVSSLGGLDGMLFEFSEPVGPPNGMGMDDVLIPLDVAFFDADRRLIGIFTMPLCTAQPPCPTYLPSRPFEFAVEAPAGTLGWLPSDALLQR